MTKTRIPIGGKMVMLVPDKWAYADRDRRFAKKCDEGAEVFQTRNRQYGDAIRFGGLYGSVVELIGCVARLQQLVLSNEGELDEEAIRNALQDTHNYSNIAGLMLDDGNIHGEPIVEEVDEDTGNSSNARTS
jgi:hypothetical protein